MKNLDKISPTRRDPFFKETHTLRVLGPPNEFWGCLWREKVPLPGVSWLFL